MKSKFVHILLFLVFLVLLNIVFNYFNIPTTNASQCSDENGYCMVSNQCSTYCSISCLTQDYDGNPMGCGVGQTCCDGTGFPPTCNTGFQCDPYPGVPAQQCCDTTYNNGSSVCDNSGTCQTACTGKGGVCQPSTNYCSGSYQLYGCSHTYDCCMPANCSSGTVNCGGFGVCGGETANSCNNSGSQSQTCTHDQPQTCNNVQFTNSQSCGYNNCSAGFSASGPVGNGCVCVTNVNVFVYVDPTNSSNGGGSTTPYVGANINDNGGNNILTNSSGEVTFSGKTTGTIKMTLTVPAGYAESATNPATSPLNTTISYNMTSSTPNPNLYFYITPYYSISGNVYVDYNHNNTQDSGDNGFPTSVQVSDGVHTVSTDANGNFTFPSDDVTGTHTISIVNSSIPAGYQAQIASTPVTVNGANVNNVLLSVTPLFTIAGLTYNDYNKDGYFNGTDNAYTLTPSSFTLSNGPTTLPSQSNNGGIFSFAPILSGTYTVSYTNLPTGYTMTYPLNGTPPSFTITVGTPGKTGCSIGNAHDAVCDASGSLSNVDFGITNENSVTQLTCTDGRFNEGYAQIIPSTMTVGGCGAVSGPYAILQNPAFCPAPTTSGEGPGILFSGSLDPSYGAGSASVSNLEVGNSTFPEIFNTRIPNVIGSSYDFVKTTLNNVTVPPVSLTSICPDLSSCSLSELTPGGVYTTNASDGPVTLSVLDTDGVSHKLGQANYTFLIHNNLTLASNIAIQASYGAAFISSGDIHVAGTVGESDFTSSNPDLEGFYSADGSFIIDAQNPSGQQCDINGNPKELRFNLQGSVITNAGGNGGSMQNLRDGCKKDQICPTANFTADPLQILHAPGSLKPPYTLWQELNP